MVHKIAKDSFQIVLPLDDGRRIRTYLTQEELVELKNNIITELQKD